MKSVELNSSGNNLFPLVATFISAVAVLIYLDNPTEAEGLRYLLSALVPVLAFVSIGIMSPFLKKIKSWGLIIPFSFLFTVFMFQIYNVASAIEARDISVISDYYINLSSQWNDLFWYFVILIFDVLVFLSYIISRRLKKFRFPLMLFVVLNFIFLAAFGVLRNDEYILDADHKLRQLYLLVIFVRELDYIKKKNNINYFSDLLHDNRSKKILNSAAVVFLFLSLLEFIFPVVSHLAYTSDKVINESLLNFYFEFAPFLYVLTFLIFTAGIIYSLVFVNEKYLVSRMPVFIMVIFFTIVSLYQIILPAISERYAIANYFNRLSMGFQVVSLLIPVASFTFFVMSKRFIKLKVVAIVLSSVGILSGFVFIVRGYNSAFYNFTLICTYLGMLLMLIFYERKKNTEGNYLPWENSYIPLVVTIFSGAILYFSFSGNLSIINIVSLSAIFSIALQSASYGKKTYEIYKIPVALTAMSFLMEISGYFHNSPLYLNYFSDFFYYYVNEIFLLLMILLTFSVVGVFAYANKSRPLKILSIVFISIALYCFSFLIVFSSIFDEPYSFYELHYYRDIFSVTGTNFLSFAILLIPMLLLVCNLTKNEKRKRKYKINIFPLFGLIFGSIISLLGAYDVMFEELSNKIDFIILAIGIFMVCYFGYNIRRKCNNCESQKIIQPDKINLKSD